MLPIPISRTASFSAHFLKSRASKRGKGWASLLSSLTGYRHILDFHKLFICTLSTVHMRTSYVIKFALVLIILVSVSYFRFLFFFCSSYRWTKDGQAFDPSAEPELKMSEHPGESAFMGNGNTIDTLKQYQGDYVCFASNELGTAVSNKAKLRIEGMDVPTAD